MLKTGKTYISLLFLLLFLSGYSQELVIQGTVSDQLGNPMLGASVGIPAQNSGTITNDKGFYSIQLQARNELIIVCSFLGYEIITDTLVIANQTIVSHNFVLKEKTQKLEDIEIVGIQQRENTLTRINMKSVNQLPNTSGNIETLVKSMSGVISGNELSSQYSVRGGNFDENLIYVNDIEIYRPFLVQSAMQEGLSFVNPQLVSSLQFSAGGFNAQYGDKMASVLDVNYKRPTEFEGSVYASMLGAGMHLAGATKNNRLSLLSGFRYKTTNYLLNSLDVEGEYLPRFADFQALVHYSLSKKSSISVLGNYSTNRFNLVPETRNTTFGSIQQTYSLRVFYDGNERDRFDSYQGAVSYSYTPSQKLTLKFIGSVFNTDEEVNFDIASAYWLDAISQVSAGNDTSINIGTGSSLEHARNSLHGYVYALEHRGSYFLPNSAWRWGLKTSYESIDDKLSEWRLLDSAGMSIPFSDEFILLDYSFKAQNVIESFRYQAFIQNSSRFFITAGELDLTLGARFSYWDFNNEILFSPRGTISLKPYWDRHVQFYFATGVYSQPPFYKELKGYDGTLFTDTKAQKSYHFVLGNDYHYQAWGRPFILTTQIYYKHYSHLIPYRVEDIQVKYLPQYKARGYARGIDFRVNGEFVPDAESWFSVSFLQTQEDAFNDDYVNYLGKVVSPGYYRRPSDQRLTVSVFFQDYLPSNPDFKVHLLLNYGTGLPYSGPNPERPSENFELNQYRRVDLGFSRIIRREKKKTVGLNNIWISFEILNLFDAPNMVSYDWVRTVENNDGFQDSFAVPNYLTGRRYNFKISAKL
jgi:hypothetical protein